MNLKLKIVLVEDEPAILRGIKSCISSLSPYYEIIGTAFDGSDAIDLILQAQPDIVITDIQLPTLTGLELIDTLRKKSKTISFIILTGFANFDFAKEAIRLQVTDYLLKPVDPDALESILARLYRKKCSEMLNLQSKYLTKLLQSQECSSRLSHCFNGFFIYMMFVFWGSAVSHTYTKYIPALDSLNINNLQSYVQPFRSSRFEILLLDTSYPNAKLFTFVSESESNTFIFDTMHALFENLPTYNSFKTGILSDVVTSPHHTNLKETINECFSCAPTMIKWGQNSIFHYLNQDRNPNLSLSPWMPQIMQEINMRIISNKTAVHTLIQLWAVHKTTQFQLLTDMRYMIYQYLQQNGSSSDHMPDITRLIAEHSSYTDLENSLCHILEELYISHYKLEDNKSSADILAENVHKYLKENFTQNISYRNFQNLFGYNEKYISQIFSAKYGCSPKKYITALRIDTAKQLIRNNRNFRLKDIAEAVGYDDPLYFSRTFKCSEGISPKEYRIQNCKSEQS